MQARSRIALLGTLATLAAFATPALAQEAERTYRKITLDNGLRVLIASDPGVNTSSASMAVGVGANADPKDSQGLAHFLEHMLFLGTKKYPKLNAYSDYLQAHGGSSNAYTAQDLTNYHFQVNHDGFPEALDRFAQFFVSPTLAYEHAKREVMAVNSEHQKNTMDDNWRLMQLQRSHMRAEHPASKFSTGNAKTLADAKEDVLRGFFNDYYKPDNMSLAVIGKASLDELERMVRARFKDVKAGKAKPWTMSPDLVEDAKGLRLIKAVPIKDMRQLQIFFEVPSQAENGLSKLGNLVGMTMGDEGKGSLLSYLKDRGLATSLSAGLGGTRYYSSVSATVGLTPKGLENWRQVLELCFAYTKMLQTSDFPQHVWDEAKTLATLNDKYSPKPEGMQAAIGLANDVLEHGLEVGERVATTFEAPKPGAWKALVGAMTPKNAIVFLVAKGLETDKKEQHYGTDYSYTVETGEAFSKLNAVKVPKEIHLPLANPFVPKNAELHPVQPVLLQKDRGVTLYYAQDTEFRRPKVAIHLHILSNKAYDTPRNATLTSLYASVLQEQLNEYSYPALMAGLRYSLAPTRKGLLLTVSGYSGSALKLLSIVGKALRGDLDKETFERVRLRTVEATKNFRLGQAYGLVSELARKVSYERYVLPSESLSVLQTVELAALKTHVEVLLNATHIEGLCAGNLTADDARGAVKALQTAIASKGHMDPKTAHTDKVLLLKDTEEVVLKRVGDTDQACLRLDYQVGRSDVGTRMASELIARALKSAFYTEMRTKQKLGYIVFSGTFNRENVQSLVFLVQSGTHDAEDLQARADACVAGLPKVFADMPDAQFEAVRQSLIQDRQKAVKSIAGRAGRFFTSAFNKDGNFRWLEAEIKALKGLEKPAVADLLKATVENKTRIVFLINGKQHGKFKTPGTLTDFDAFIKEHSFIDERAGNGASSAGAPKASGGTSNGKQASAPKLPKGQVDVSHVRVGQRYNYEGTVSGMRMEYVYEVLTLEESSIRYRLTTRIHIKGMAKPTDNSMEGDYPLINLAGPGGPPMQGPNGKPMNKEFIKVSGEEFECWAIESDQGTTYTPIKNDLPTWPPFVKIDTKTMQMELKSIQQP